MSIFFQSPFWVTLLFSLFSLMYGHTHTHALTHSLTHTHTHTLTYTGVIDWWGPWVLVPLFCGALVVLIVVSFIYGSARISG